MCVGGERVGEVKRRMGGEEKTSEKNKVRKRKKGEKRDGVKSEFQCRSIYCTQNLFYNAPSIKIQNEPPLPPSLPLSKLSHSSVQW